jgi:hypothetical protein
MHTFVRPTIAHGTEGLAAVGAVVVNGSVLVIAVTINQLTTFKIRTVDLTFKIKQMYKKGHDREREKKKFVVRKKYSQFAFGGGLGRYKAYLLFDSMLSTKAIPLESVVSQEGFDRKR